MTSNGGSPHEAKASVWRDLDDQLEELSRSEANRGLTRRQLAALTGAAALFAVTGGLVLPDHAAHADILWHHPFPYRAKINRGFGRRKSPGDGGSTNHQGIDYGSTPASGAPIYAVATGTVVARLDRYRGDEGTSWGNYLKIDHGSGYTSLYAHMIGGSVFTGSTVTPETIVGEVGTTGNSTGPHLHLEIRKNGVALDPAPIVHNASLTRTGGTDLYSAKDRQRDDNIAWQVSQIKLTADAIREWVTEQQNNKGTLHTKLDRLEWITNTGTNGSGIRSRLDTLIEHEMGSGT
jgi:hypothetical protein